MATPEASAGAGVQLVPSDRLARVLRPPAPPMLLTPPVLLLLPDPATCAAPAVAAGEPPLPLGPPPELSEPAVLLGPGPGSAPALESVPAAASEGSSSLEQPPVASSVVHQSAAKAHAMERRVKEPGARGEFGIFMGEDCEATQSGAQRASKARSCVSWVG